MKPKDKNEQPELKAAPSLRQLKEWNDEKVKHWTDARDEYLAAEKEGKLSTPELQAGQKAHLDAIAELNKKITEGLHLAELHRVAAEDAELRRRLGDLNTPVDQALGPGAGTPQSQALERPPWVEEIAAGQWNGTALAQHRASEEYAKFVQQVGDGPKGGYQVPTLHVQGLHRNYPMYQLEALCRNIFVTDYSDFHLDAVIGFAMDKAAYLSPGEEAPERDYETDRRLLTPIRQTAQNVTDRPMNRLSGYAAEVEAEMGLQFLRSTEAAICNGPDKVLGPAGLFTTDPGGLPTDRDQAGNNTATVIKDEGIIDAVMHLKAESRKSPSLRWVMHRETIGKCWAIKDTQGRFLLQVSLRAGEPDILAGIPIVESEEAPHTFTTGKRVAVLADLRHYVMVHWLNGMVMAFDASQHYATKGREGTVYERYNTGAVMTKEAFSVVKMG